MASVTLSIASPGTLITNHSPSFLGHVWISVMRDDGTTVSGGFAPVATEGLAQIHGKGHVLSDDSSRYQERSYVRTVEINDIDALKIENFIKNPSEYGFNLTYDAFSNSCIDFAYRALQFSTDIDLGDGALLPMSNASRLERIIDSIEYRANELGATGTGLLIEGSIGDMIHSMLPQGCFLAGTSILMADGTTKPIEDIRPGDEVASFDPYAQRGLGPLRSGRVARTFTNVTRTIVNLRGTQMTPGHVVLMDNGDWGIIARALLDDRVIIEQRGARAVSIRARTGAELGSTQDIPIKIVFRDPETGSERFAVARAGIPVVAAESARAAHELYSMADILTAQHYVIEPDGTIVDKSGTCFDATPWAGEELPDALPIQQNWLLELDGGTYTPQWILDLPQGQEDVGQMVVNAGSAEVRTKRPGLRLLN